MKPVLGTLVLILLSGMAGGQELSPPPGTYKSPLTVTLGPSGGASVHYRFLETPSPQVFLWSSPLTLEALGGEKRIYTLRISTEKETGETTTKDYRYEVDHPMEPQPTVAPVPGTFNSAVSIQPTLPPGWSLNLDGRPAEGPVTLDAPSGTTRTFLLAARRTGQDPWTWTYTIDKRDQEAVSVELLSPVPGTWDNAQALVAAFKGVDRVVWSYGPHLDAGSAQVYEGPVLLDRPGLQTLTLAGHSRLGGWVEKTVAWTNGVSTPPIQGWPASGIHLGGLDLPEAPGFSLSWDEGRSWQTSRAVHNEAPSSTSRKVLVVQAKKERAVFRYVWWLDARPPQVPILQFVGGWNPQLLFSGSAEVLHHVTWTGADGKVIEDIPLWGPVGAWKVPDGVVGAKVAALGLNGVEGKPATLGFSETGWSTPGWEPWDGRGPQTDRTVLPLGGLVPSRPGFRAAYEVSDRPDVPEPGTGSPWLNGAFLPAVPWGADRTFYARFAWRDEAGLTGPASPVVAVRVDRVPPLSPEVQESGGQVLVKPMEGEEEGTDLFWAVTTERVASADGLTFQPYRSALASDELRSGAPGKLWFHAKAKDRAGNWGPPRLNMALDTPGSDHGGALVQVDSDPTVGEMPVEDGGVYPWSQFRLRALDQSRNLWVGVTDLGVIPADWKTKLQPWVGVFSRSVGRGERRTFVVYWNAKTAYGWLWPQPNTLKLTLDQGPPTAPVLADPWPQGPLSTAWTLSLHPGRLGDSLRYSFTLDGTLPPDPKLSGDPWPGSRSWDAPALGKVAVRLRVVAVSVSGLAVEIPLTSPVTIDKSVPAPVTPGLESFTYRSGPFVVPLTAEGTVRYSVTSDGSLPLSPTASAPALERPGLVLTGIPGQTLLYRFRWRSFSASGIPGPASDVYAVLVDRTAAVASAPSGDPEKALPVPRITGFPASGVSSSPVVLKADGLAGLLRYEVSEGVGPPRPVTLESPLWDQSLNLDPGAGLDRSYAISLRGFSPDGRPITDETRYAVRIDRSVPEASTYDLIPDPRRPEGVLRAPSGNPDETLVYRWFWDSFPQGTGESSWQTIGDQPPRFVAPDGNLTHLRVQAYLRDEAGNEGPVTEKTLLIDQNVVYAAPKGSGDGSRSRPAGTLTGALDLARRTGKSILFLAEGTYQVTRTADLGGLQVFGGLNADQWESTPGPQRSVLVAQAPFDGGSLLESGDRDWFLSGVDLSTGSATLDQVVLVRGAAVTVKGSTWNWSKATGGWDQVGGSLDWVDVAASYTAQPGGTFVDLRAAQVSVRGLSLMATQNQGGLLFSLKDTGGLFQDLVVVSQKASGFDGVWSVNGGHLTVSNSRVQAGDGAGRATAFLLRDTEAVFFNLDVSLYAASSNTAFQTTGGRLELQKSNLSLVRGDEFNQGVVVDHGQAVLRTFEIKVETGSYQGGFSIDGGVLTLGSGKVHLAGGGQRAWGAQFLDSTLVTIDDVVWALDSKTQGEVWKVGKPWLSGSTVNGSTATGW